MPFKSKRQLQTCYGKKYSKKGTTWDCDKWLKETPNPNCLPTTINSPKPRKCRPLKEGEKIVGPVINGPRGGKYFMVADIKVYIPKK